MLAQSIIIVKYNEVIIIERLGQYYKTLEPGLHFIFPCFDAPRKFLTPITETAKNGKTYISTVYSERISLNETVYYFPYKIITKDGVKIEFNVHIQYKIINPKWAVYNIDNLPNAIANLVKINLKNEIKELTYDEFTENLEQISNNIKEITDKAAYKLGAKVNRIEVSDIILPDYINL